MTKSELVEEVATQINISKSRAEVLVNTLFDAMTAALEKGESIEIRGFGTFSVRSYDGYRGRNPRTGESVDVGNKRLPFFKVGRELLEMINGGQVPSTLGDDDDDDEHHSGDSNGKSRQSAVR